MEIANMRMFMLAAVVGLLAACATATPYQAAPPGQSTYGFSEQQIENNRVRITFRGNSMTDRETVETYLLYRAAELTLQSGRDYFIVANRDTEEHSRLQGTGPHYPRFWYDYRFFSPRHGWSPWYDPFWSDYSSYREVRRMDGQVFSVGDFLREVRRLVTDFALGRLLHGASTEGLDDWTRYYLMHRASFDLGTAPVGECILFAQGYGIDLDDLRGPRGLPGKAKST